MPKKAHFPGVNRVRRHDAVYFYHRATGIRLPDDYGSAAFAKAWAEAEAQKAAPVIIAKTEPRSYAGLIEAYKADGAWLGLKPRTRRDYQNVIDWMSGQGSDPRPADALNQSRCEKLLDLAVKERGWRQGVYVLQFNRRLYGWVQERAARKKLWGGVNPWEDLPTPPKPRSRKVHRPWLPHELVEVLFEAPLGLRRAYVLGASGFDGGTMVGRLWTEYRNGGFEIDREKTGAASFVMVPPVLQMLLEDGERPSDYIVTTVPGDPFTIGGLQKRSSEFLAAMAKAGRVGAGLTLHGLRHTIGKAVADSGGTLHAIQSALQHKSPRMALYYSEQADKKRALLGIKDPLDLWFQQTPLASGLQKTGGKRKNPEDSK